MERRIVTKKHGFTVIRHLATISDNGNGGTLELNEVIYNSSGDGYDLRRWNGDEPQKSGIQMDDYFLKVLYSLVARYKQECPEEIALMTNDGGTLKITRQEVKTLIETLIGIMEIMDEKKRESANNQPRRTRRTRHT